tara:strand:+ start:38 stop:616 length:579 start_codon:yes stop_codon:yes gene_type:complete
MKKLLTLLLLSPLAFSSEFTATDAIEVIKKDLHRRTQLKPECIDFYLLDSGKPYSEGLIKPLTKDEALARSTSDALKNNKPVSFNFDLRERHNEKCGGDPDTSPRLTTINVSRDMKSNKIIARASHFFCGEVKLDEYSIDMDCPLRKYCVYYFEKNSSGEIEAALRDIDDECPLGDPGEPFIRSYIANPEDR